MKIKTFEFELTNYNSESVNIRFIDSKINNFIKDKKVIDIKTNTIDIRYHNNGYSNTVALVYTILYENLE